MYNCDINVVSLLNKVRENMCEAYGEKSKEITELDNLLRQVAELSNSVARYHGPKGLTPNERAVVNIWKLPEYYGR